MTIIEWLKSLYKQIQKSDNKELEDILTKQEEISLHWIKKYEDLEEEVKKIVDDNIRLYNKLQQLEAPKAEKPSWLIGAMKYKPKRRFVSKTLDITKTFTKPQYCFDKSTLLYDLLKKNNLLNVEKTFVNMKKIMRLITSMIGYEYDKTDNWRPITDILMFGEGDCDDSGGIAITSALGMAGWNEDEVFAATGWYYSKGKKTNPTTRCGHAWGIAKCNGKWYVLEGTSKTAVPRLWKDWADKYECCWGICNWRWNGMIANKKTYLDEE